MARTKASNVEDDTCLAMERTPIRVFGNARSGRRSVGVQMMRLLTTSTRSWTAAESAGQRRAQPRRDDLASPPSPRVSAVTGRTKWSVHTDTGPSIRWREGRQCRWLLCPNVSANGFKPIWRRTVPDGDHVPQYFLTGEKSPNLAD